MKAIKTLTVPQAAAILGVKVGTIRYMCLHKQLRATKAPGPKADVWAIDAESVHQRAIKRGKVTK